MKLYTFPASPGCRPIAMFIADHGMTVEEQVVDLMNGEQYGPAFTAINPNNAVPVLEDGDLRLPECSAILKYLADMVESPAYPKDLKARAQVNAAMDWVNTGLYPAFGHNLCYPQVLAFAKWEDDKAQSLVLGRGQTRSRKLLGVMNDAMLGADNLFLCGKVLSIADYQASGIISLGELTGCDFSPWPNVERWYRRMEAMPNWQKANAPLYDWAKFTKGPEYVRV
jgi:glutathione S-transferase